MHLEIDSGAIEDLKESISYYEKEAGKGQDFENDFDIALDRIIENPQLYQVLDEVGYRRCFLKTFPYSVFFKIMKDHIYVIAVGHHRRKPNFWIKRGKN